MKKLEYEQPVQRSFTTKRSDIAQGSSLYHKALRTIVEDDADNDNDNNPRNTSIPKDVAASSIPCSSTCHQKCNHFVLCVLLQFSLILNGLFIALLVFGKVICRFVA